MRLNTLRNRLAWAICNVVLATIASREYRGLIKGSITLGLRTAARIGEEQK